MKNTKNIIMIGVAIVVLGAVAAILIKQRAPQPAQPVQAVQAAGVNQTQPEPPPVPEPVAAPPPLPLAPPAELAPAPAPLPTPPKASAGIKPPKAKEPIKDPLAREALSLVGIDPQAEAYWYAAINDPNLSAHERQDLIEDLNEDGFSDPKHPTVEDLPLIMSRIVWIEEAALDPMDQVNADAFREAYKDLMNMLDRLTR